MASITLNNVVKTYDDGFTAVKGIDLEVAGDLLRQRVRLTMSKDF